MAANRQPSPAQRLSVVRNVISRCSSAGSSGPQYTPPQAAAALAKVRVKDPTVVTPKEVLMMATLNGAKAQGRTDCGTLAAGKKADMIMLRTDVPNMHPVHNMVNNLVYAGDSGDIVMTIVDGKILYNNGEYTTIDIEKTIFEAETATEKILKML